MRKNTNLKKFEEGIVGFLPLVIIAVLLIGLVGYVSVNKLKSSSNPIVLSDSSSVTGSSDSGSSSSDTSSTGIKIEDSTVSNDSRTETETPEPTEAKDNSGSDGSELQGNELDDVTNQLNSLDSLDTGIPEVDNSIKANNAALKNGSLQNVSSAELQASASGQPQTVRVRGVQRVKLFGVIPVDANVTLDVNSDTGEQLSVVDQPFYLKYLDFLFTK